MDFVRFERRDRVGLVVLDRPNVLNALDIAMFDRLGRQLAAWRDDPEIEAVVIRGEGRAFSAGGDITAVRRAALDRDDVANDLNYRTEYSLNALIADYPKPYVALIHGYCMGGGLGVAVHGSHRVVFPTAQLAMPEVAIGFFPDIGASCVLGRLPGGLGLYLGLSGARLSAADALHARLATHAVGAIDPSELATEIVDSASIEPTLARYAAVPPAGDLAIHGAAIERAFDAASSVRQIVARLEDDAAPWARAAAERMRAGSPTSLALTFAMIRQGRSLDLRTALRIEYLLAKAYWRAPDFSEGVRALVVDKDRTPAWSPARLDDVELDAVDALLADATERVRRNADAPDRVDPAMFAA